MIVSAVVEHRINAKANIGSPGPEVIKLFSCSTQLSMEFEMLVSIILSRNSPGRVAQSVGHLTRKSGVLGSIPGLATYFRFPFRFFKKGSCQLLAKVCARSTG